MTNSYPSGSGLPNSNMPTGPLGAPGRRSSYASVVSGAAPMQSLPRSGAFSHLLNQNPSDYSHDPSYHGQRNDGRGYDTDMSMNTSRGYSGSWARNGQLPSFSSAFGALANGNGWAGSTHGEHFFTPSYLRSSKYVQRLEEAHRAKQAALKDGPSTTSSQPGSLSTSASSVNLHAKMAPSHRGMTYDLIEKAPPIEEPVLAPLPSKWNTADKYGTLEVLSDGQEVKFTGQKSTSERDLDACAIRADHPMPSQCGIYYFEVTVISRKREESSIGIGFSAITVPLSRLPGWEPSSWAYHGDDGCSFCCQSSGKSYGPPFTSGDTIGCGVNFRTGSAFFTKNGDNLGTVFRDIKGKLYPSVGMKKSGEHIRVNFGQSPFIFDIDGMMARERQQIMLDIEQASTSKLAPPLNETDLIQQLVLQFLQHDGYVETARAFAQEVHAEKKALSMDPNAVISGLDIKEDEDAAHRQRIRAALLEGDIDKALKYTNVYYPHVLKDNENVYFRLRVRKFIEMIRQGAELHNTGTTNGSKKNGQGENWYDDNITQEMELDDHQEQNGNFDKMDTSEPSDSLKYLNLMNETIEYGRILQAEFKDDQRREISKALEDAFALMAYPDPTNAKEVSYLLDPSGRLVVAEELNSAILLSLGKSSSAALEQLYQQTSVLLEDLAEGGAAGAFVNIDDYIRPKSLARR